MKKDLKFALVSNLVAMDEEKLPCELVARVLLMGWLPSGGVAVKLTLATPGFGVILPDMATVALLEIIMLPGVWAFQVIWVDAFVTVNSPSLRAPS